MIIPWQVDVPKERWPFINWLIITGAIVASFFQLMSILEREHRLPSISGEYRNHSVEDLAKEFKVEEKRLKEIEQAAEKAHSRFREFIIKQAILKEYFVWGKVRPFILKGWDIKGLFGHIWLHGHILHLLGNMFFLWIFGNAVCAKIGNFSYLPIYLGLGLISGITHLVFVGGNALGASGAIYGVLGMYLVFFPINEITCYAVFPFRLIIRPYVKKFSASSIWIILFWLVFNVWWAIMGGGRVAYLAHIGGFTGGFVLAILMLKLKIVKMERYEKSLLQVLADYKKPPPNEDEFEPQYKGYLGMIQKELQKQPKSIATSSPVEQKTIPLESEVPKEEFILFTCSCGKRLKMPSKYAGRMGRCPKCNSHVRIPDK